MYNRNLIISVLVIFSFVIFISCFEFLFANAIISTDIYFDNTTITLNLLGLNVKDLTEEQAQTFNLHKSFGLLVTKIVKGSPAERAMIQKDDIILEVNNHQIQNKSALITFINNTKFSDNLTLTILRNNEIKVIPIFNIDKVNIPSPYENSTLFAKPQLLNWSSYYNNEFTIKYPFSWNISTIDSQDSEQKIIYFRSLPEDKYDITKEYIKISITDEIGLSLDSLVPPVGRDLYDQNGKIQNITIDNLSGKFLIFKYIDSKYGEIKIFKSTIIKNSQVYTITYFAESKKFEDYLPTIFEMIHSLKIHSHKTYSNLDQKFTLEYPSNVLVINQIYESERFDSNSNTIKFLFNNTYNSNIFPFLSIQTSETFYEQPIDDFDKRKIINYLNKTELINFKSTNSNVSKYIDNKPTYKLEYSYYDPFLGEINGILLYTKFSTKEAIIQYEDQKNTYNTHLPLFLGIIDSVKFFEIKPVFIDEKGLYLAYPDYWKIVNNTSNEIKFTLNEFSTSTLGIQLIDFKTLNNSESKLVGHKEFKDMLITLKDSDCIYKNFDIYYNSDHNYSNILNRECHYLLNGNTIKSLESYWFDHNNNNKLYNITYTTNYEDFETDLSLIKDFVERYIILFNLGESNDSLPNKFSNGIIKHPFEISYSNSWSWREEVGGFLGKTVLFYLSNQKSISNSFPQIRISYWNEKDFSMVKEESFDRESYIKHFKNNITNLKINGLYGKTSLYIYPYGYNSDDEIAIIFYGKDDSSGNFKISFIGTVTDFLAYWTTAKKMIESVKLIEPIKKVEPKGIIVEDQPTGIFFDENEDIIFALNSGSSSVSIINATNFQVLKNIYLENLNSEPFDLAYNSKYKSLFIVNNNIQTNSGGITKIQFASKDENIDYKNYSITTLIENSRIFPVDIVVNKNNSIFVGDPLNNTLYIMNEKGIFKTILLESNKGYTGGIGLTLDEAKNTLYIANPNSKKIHIVDTLQNKIIDNITINNPDTCLIDSTIDRSINKLYVIDSRNNCFSDPNSQNGNLIVIDTLTNEVSDLITIGKSPNNVAVDYDSHKVFVTNGLSDSLTIIDPFTYEKNTISEVGVSPMGVTTNSKDGLVYVSSSNSKSIILVNSKTNEIQHNTQFKIEPENAGIIKCNNKNYLLNEIHLISDGTQCSAEPTGGFIFHSWSDKSGNEVFESKRNSNSVFDNIKNILLNLTGKDTSNNKLPIRTSGTFNANFVESYSIIPKEQLTELYVLAAGIFSSWLIPNITRWLYSDRKIKRQNKTFSEILNKIESLEESKNLNRHDMKLELIDKLSKGMLNDDQYFHLDNKLKELDSAKKI